MLSVLFFFTERKYCSRYPSKIIINETFKWLIIKEKKAFLQTSVNNFHIDIDTAILMFVDFKRRMLALLLLINYFEFKSTLIMEVTKNPSGISSVNK